MDRGGGGVGVGGGSLKLSGLKAPDTAEEVLQDVAEFRPEAPTCRMREPHCCRIIIIIIINNNTSLTTVSPLHLIRVQFWFCLFEEIILYRRARVASGYFRNHSFVCRLQLCVVVSHYI